MMTQQQEFFYVVGFHTNGSIDSYLSIDDTVVTEIDDPHICVFRTLRAAKETGRYGKVIRVHRDFLDVNTMP